MFGIDVKSIEQQMKNLQDLANDQKKLANAVEGLNTLMPQLIVELKRLNENLEKK